MMETGFLVEITLSGGSMYLFVTPSGAWDFTTASHKALRFSRKIDGEEMIRGLKIPSCIVTEHQWGTE